jgi:hypothetical protein
MYEAHWITWCYTNLGMFAPLVFVAVLSISQEDVGKIKANLDTLITSVRDLTALITAVMTEQANQARTLGILCSQRAEDTKRLDDYETRLRGHTKSIVLLDETVEEHGKDIEKIKLVVFPSAIGTHSFDDSGDEKQPMSTRIILTILGAIGGIIALLFLLVEKVIIPLLAHP